VNAKGGRGIPFKQAGKVVLAAIMLFGSFSEVCTAEDMDPKDLIGQMSDAIAGLDRFRVDGDAYADWRLPAGLIVENASEITVRGSEALSHQAYKKVD